MLLDNEEKTVELFFDNILRGTISINTVLIDELPTHVGDHLYNYKEKFKKWRNLRNQNQKNEFFIKLTNELYNFIFDFRFTGVYIGEIRDSDLEKENKLLREQLKAVNKKIATQEIKDQLFGEQKTALDEPKKSDSQFKPII